MRRSACLGLAVFLCAGAQLASGQNAARELVERQASAWEKQKFNLAADDWLPTAVLTSPEGNTKAPQSSVYGARPPGMRLDTLRECADLIVKQPRLEPSAPCTIPGAEASTTRTRAASNGAATARY